MIKRIQNASKFYIERFILKGAKNQLLFIAAVVAVISFISGFIHSLLYPEVELLDSIWWGFLRLSDPGYLGDDQGVARRMISTIVTILGYVVFLGSLVAIMTQWLNSTIKRFELGLTPISQRGHILILGYTNRTPIIVRELLLSEERVNIFLKRIKRSKLHIVILSEVVNPVIVYELKQELKTLWDQRLITFRSGLSLKVEHLDRVDFLNAGAVIIPGTNIHYGESTKVDSNIIKTLMTISHHAANREMPYPYCVTEITDPQKISVIRSSYDGDLEIISSNLIISRLISQNVRHEGLSAIYSELLKNEGNELYLTDAEEYTGEVFRDLRGIFSKAILVGIMRNEGEKVIPMMNPDGSTEIIKDDYLVVLSENQKESVPDRNPGKLDVSLVERIKDAPRSISKKILIVGWNSKVPTLLSEFDSYKNDSYEIDIFSMVPVEERTSFINQYVLNFEKVTVKHITGDSTVKSEFRNLDTISYDTVIMLANDWLNTGEESDARTIMAYMFLRSIFARQSYKPHFIIELIDPDNIMLFDKNECEVLISSHIISYALSQVALRKRLRILFDDIFSAGGTEIYFKDAVDYNLVNRKMSFKEIEEEVYRYGDIAMGIYLNGNGSIDSEVVLNPEKNKFWELSAYDKLIILDKEYDAK